MERFTDNKEFRINLLEVVKKHYDEHNNIRAIDYKMRREELTYEVRGPQRCNLDGLKEGKCYYLKAVNEGTEKRTRWVWLTYEEVTRKRMNELYLIHNRNGRARYNELLPEVLERIVLDFPSAKEAYKLWTWAKAVNGGKTPSLPEVLAAAPPPEADDVSTQTLLFMEKLIIDWRRHLLDKDFFGDGTDDP